GRASRVAVRDEGPGLTSEQQLHIWERFHRVPGVKQRSGGDTGLGLGLYISRTIIELHGGQVGVESVAGHGATFWFTLPLASAPATSFLSSPRRRPPRWGGESSHTTGHAPNHSPTPSHHP